MRSLIVSGFCVCLVLYAGCSDTINQQVVTQIVDVPRVSSISKHAQGFSFPQGLAFDSSGNLLVVNTLTGVISRVHLAGAVDTITTAAQVSAWIAVGPTGHIYVSSYGDGTVKRVPSTGGTMTNFVTGQDNPAGIAFDKAGNLYIANFNSNQVRIKTPSADTVFATFAYGPTGLVFDNLGNLFVSHQLAHTISKVSPSGTISTFATGILSPHNIAFDNRGNLFVSQSTPASRTITVITATHHIYQFSADFYWPTGIAFDSQGSLYVSNYDSTFVSKVTIQY
ncbi:MAG: hypothetical protein WEF53_11225 [Bacteroidota bacterium]